MAMEETEEVIMDETSSESQICEDFYENIEAPKFVDLTAPDRRPIGDDRYWFCARVGCDQNHEDDEAIYKDFLLRVMAARSPSVRLRKTLCRKASSTHPKCPNTVPPKPSRSRISKLAMISSIPQKDSDRTRPKAGQAMSEQKHAATPKTKGKGQDSSVEAKSFTVSGKQKDSVTDPGSLRSVQNPKDRVVAKVLVFHSPKKKKKAVKLKRSVELRSSVKKICNGMRKLEIAKKRNVLGFDHKPVPSDQPRQPLKRREVKSRVFDSLHSKKQNGDKAKCPETLRKRVKDKGEVLVENKTEELRDTVKHDENKGNVEENDRELKLEPRLEETKEREDKENATEAEVNCRDNEEEVMESDDKENASAIDSNRKADNFTDPSIKKKAFGKKETSKMPPKVASTTDKCSNGKYTKPKPTNPKPFRLRTDERRILKEANAERKQHLPSAKEETTTLLGSNTIRRKQEIQENRATPRVKGSSKPLLRPDSSDQDKNSERVNPFVRKQTAAVSQRATTTPSGRKKRIYKEASKMILEESKEVEAVERTATTVPRGPNFHSIHVPKSCTKRRFASVQSVH
ncbi:PREDICTED: uncharacterized protein LOC104807193 isoform X2 [Tarenaya hassleriana]|uniref:uncharacterized protein LOC104807193 isoform X2 n=1 Tax=Tarenaya hassleriana TaxID=28532 RepID=UPI00053C38E0|nr:PREDICTED: uncharacterized protein LOC104807193 isoform X2 [Tarenaya hassleriana]